MRHSLPALTLALSGIATVAAQPAGERTDLTRWTAAVLAYQPGPISGTTREIGAWEWSRLKPVIDQVRSRGTPKVLLKGAAMYLDLAVQVPRDDRPIYPTSGLGVFSRDGRPVGTHGLDSQIWWGRVLVITALSRHQASEQQRELAITWFRTVTAVFSQRLNFADLQPHLSDAAHHLADEPGVLFDAGCAAETLASPLLQATIRSRLPQRSPAPNSSLTFLRDAEKKYRAARQAMPDHRESHVRLGRVLSLMGRYDEALNELETAVRLHSDTVVDYFNWLFLGDVLTHTRRFDDAVAAFVRAGSLYPDAGAPQLGVSRVHSEEGNLSGARAALANLIRTRPEAALGADPRWHYDRCNGRNSDSVYPAVHRALQTGVAMNRLGRLAITAVLSAASASAQPKFTSRVESVRVDVLVTQGGVVVPGLTAEDFEVRDNGAPQQVRMIGAGTLPLDVTLALDMSSSLEAERLATLRRAGSLLLNGLTKEDRASLLTFSHAVTQRQAMTLDLDQVRAALDAAESGGGTSLADAMYVGITLSEAAGRRPLLIVFSDGIDTTSWLTASDAITASKRFETVVYGVSTARPSETPQILRDITAQSGGNLLHVSAKDLEASFVKILEEFRQRYLLSYTLSGPPKPGLHRIEVRIKKRGMQVKARSGYLVGPSRLP